MERGEGQRWAAAVVYPFLKHTMFPFSGEQGLPCRLYEGMLHFLFALLRTISRFPPSSSLLRTSSAPVHVSSLSFLRPASSASYIDLTALPSLPSSSLPSSSLQHCVQNMQDKLVPLLEDGVDVLVYAGDADFICNW